MDVEPLPPEKIVRFDLERDDEIPGLSTLTTSLALAGSPDLRPRFYPLGDRDLDPTVLADRSTSSA
jgi:hypothetical protein